ncbi:MAG TPA: hypothetical protein VMQ76_10830 [Terracidiphilus sp.]|nr:hypothetical protein [Terracidiphilus sp.]
MKSNIKKYIGLSALLAACLATQAQTSQSNYLILPPIATVAPPVTNIPDAAPATNLLQSIGLNSLGAGWSSFAAGFVDIEPYISNKIASIDTGLLYNPSDKKGKFGGYAAATIPLTAQSEFGLGGFYLNKTYGNAECNIQLGTTVSNFMGIGKLIGPVYTFTAAGPDYNFAKDPNTGNAYGVGSYTAAGVEKNFHLSPTWSFAPGYWVLNISTISGVGQFFNLKFTKSW